MSVIRFAKKPNNKGNMDPENKDYYANVYWRLVMNELAKAGGFAKDLQEFGKVFRSFATEKQVLKMARKIRAMPEASLRSVFALAVHGRRSKDDFKEFKAAVLELADWLEASGGYKVNL